MNGFRVAIPRRFLLLFLSIFLALFILIAFGPHVSRKISTSVSTLGIPIPEPKSAVEIFPSSVNGRIPAILTANEPPKVHHPTPMFIGFTRNWPILQQAVVSYITAGWPASDIFVVDNSGVMDSNELGLLTLQNPFFVDYPRLRLLGVNVIVTPTLFTFAQLQNFYLFTAMQRQWDHYYWSHMDSAALSDEEYIPYQSLYQRIIKSWNSIDQNERWALKFYAYDHLALVNVAAFKDVGGWDTHIPFYMGDCDMHARLKMKNYTTEAENVGHVFDVGSTVPDLSVFYPNKPTEPVNSERHKYLRKMLDDMQRAKAEAAGGRNFWQAEQRGGKGEPFYRNPEGFERGIGIWIETGRAVFAEKWGHRDCDIYEIGKKSELEWKYPRDWWVKR